MDVIVTDSRSGRMSAWWGQPPSTSAGWPQALVVPAGWPEVRAARTLIGNGQAS